MGQSGLKWDGGCWGMEASSLSGQAGAGRARAAFLGPYGLEQGGNNLI